MDVEHRRELAARSVSQSSIVIVPSGRSAMICTRLAVAAGNLHAHEAITQVRQHRLDKRGERRGKPVSAIEPVVARTCFGLHSAGGPGRSSALKITIATPSKQKERTRGPTLKS